MMIITSSCLFFCIAILVLCFLRFVAFALCTQLLSFIIIIMIMIIIIFKDGSMNYL